MLVGFLKTRVVLQAWAKQEVVFPKGLHGLQRLAADHGIDPPDLVADFPACFKEGYRGVVKFHKVSSQGRGTRQLKLPAAGRQPGGLPKLYFS